MKFKTSAIALAVAGTVAAPVAVQAGADELYASARVGLWNVDTGGTSDMEVRGFASRFGARGETDLGNGLTGFGRYEWDVDFQNGVDDVEDASGNVTGPGKNATIKTRHRYTGLKGDFGSVLVGQTYHTFYNFAVGPNDNPWWHSGYNMIEYKGRTGDSLTYAGSAGAVAFGVTGVFTPDSEEESPDETQIGASFGIGDMTLGGAVVTYADDNIEDIVGVVLTGIAVGDIGIGVGFQSQDDDTGFILDVGIGNAYIHVEQVSLDAADRDPMGITFGYTQSLGRKTTAYYEIFSLDADSSDGDDDVTRLMAVLKYDII
jgi:predicted porin